MNSATLQSWLATFRIQAGQLDTIASKHMVPGRAAPAGGRMRESHEVALLISNLAAQPHESEWLEFKESNDDPEMIARSISALANSARLLGRNSGYILWGVRDADLTAVGTTFVPATARKGNEGLFNWLMRVLTPTPSFDFHVFEQEGRRMVLLEIGAAADRPVAFSDKTYIRVGEHTKELRSVPAVEQEFWRVLLSRPFEHVPARDGVSSEQVLELLDHESYCKLLSAPSGVAPAEMLSRFEAEQLIRRDESGLWSITNLGALLFARDLRKFPRLARKAPRFIRYQGTSRTAVAQEMAFEVGYAISFENLVGTVAMHTPHNEVIRQALRQDIPLYPPTAVRELVANALVHQDLNPTGTGPIVEMFSDRLEITNPGQPLVDLLRFIDAPPKSRNEALAALMRRVGVCEERGSGWDKIAFQLEFYQLPAPSVEILGDSLRVTLRAPIPLRDMLADEKAHAVYLHACLRRVEGKTTTNASVRERFGISEANSAQASRLIKESVTRQLVKPVSETMGRRDSAYLPFWAEVPR